MKRGSILFGIISLFLSIITFTSCSNDVEIGHKPEIIKIIISAQTGLHKSSDITQDMPSIEGMKMKEDGKADWYVVPFDKITDFSYQKGYSYELLVEKRAIIDIPIYVGSTTYKLIEVLSMKKGE